MRSEWPEVRLGDHVDACLGKMLDVKKNKGTPEPYLGNSNVRWGTFDLVNLAEMRFEPHEEERYGLLSGDLIVCEGGEPGRCAIWTGTNSPRMKIQKALHRIRPKGNLNNYFLYYWFCYAAKAGLLEQHFTGTTIKHLTGKAIAALKIPLPPIEFQVALVDVLKTLDDCIALLRETNATLEAIVQALFKSWFVDFDPVHARARGEQPAGLTPEVAALFPDSVEESALGKIPKGWDVGVLGDVAETSRKQIKPEQLSAETLYVGLEHIPRKQLGLDSWGTAGELASAKSAFERNDILFGKLRPYFHKVVIAPFEGVCSTDILVCKAKQTAYHHYVAMHLFSDELIAYADRLSNGAKMPRINWKDLAAYEVTIPPSEVAEQFYILIEPMIARMLANVEQAQTLANLRDTLLPRLISGQLRLSDAEQQLKDLAV
ncbi:MULTISPECIES: restriction endonuclease subunit S [Aeromonas]|uniref:restriction endonuclease subunit S n=1 Tax=Aeromonas TaxID=642 RepID=UPI0009E4096C|nr:restriction endonuclease subunit S [Aeromonas sp. L_1B5_3]